MIENLKNIFKKDSDFQNQFCKLEFPDKKNEEWIYTNPLMLFDGINALETQNANSDLEGDITFSNGKLVKNDSGFDTKEYQPSPPDKDPVLLLQKASKSYEVNINKSGTAPVFIHQNYETQKPNNFCGSNISINIANNIEVTIVEIISAENTGLHSGLTKLVLGENANVEYIKVLPTNLSNKYLGTVITSQARDSYFNGVIVTLGGSVSRHNLIANLNEENATGNFHGLFALDNNQHSDTYSHIKHHAPRTFSSQLYKGALNGESRGVFTGKLYIARDAQEVDANQLSKNLLLSPKAHVDTRPQLEVYADDVKAAHGATVGQIGEEEIFYLQSRGIDATTAFNMLCDAFSTDVIDHIKNQKVKDFLTEELKKRSMTKTEAI